MKTTIQCLMAAIFVAASTQTHAQGVVYDQQSATGPVAVVGNGNADGLDIQPAPLTQSFIPSLSAIGFVQFELEDIPGNGNNGATVYVKLWTGSPDPRFGATLLGSTAPVYMPNGFVNNNLGSAGVTNFSFSTPIGLTPGQTYYLQPVVLSGDNPWDIITIGNTYPNGQVFVGGAGFNTDFWFREGVVPEPSTLALAGLSCLLAFGFKRHSKLPVLFLAGILFTASVLPVYSAPDSVVQATADEAGLSSVSASALPRIGTFWVMTAESSGRLMALPYPALPANLSALPIYSVAGNAFIVDDTGGQISRPSVGRMSSVRAASIAQTQAATMASLIGQILNPAADEEFQPHGFTPMFDTSGLWLEASNENNGYLGLRAHNTIGGDNYQLLSTTNLLNHSWDLGQISSGASDGYADFSPVPMTNAMTFYRAHHANPVMWIEDAQDSREPDSTNSDPGQIGIIYIQNKGWATNDVTVHYTIGGTAQNGIDYSNLTGVAIVPVNQNYAEVDIDPIADGLKPNQTVILTLIQNTNYLIDPAYDSATNILLANPQVYPTVRGDTEKPCPNTPLTFNLANDVSGQNLTYFILTWPTHGTLDTNSLPTVTYNAPTNCYEGQDSFTFQVNNGQYASTGTVTLIIADPVTAYPVSAQICRGGSVGVTLSGGDNCGETLSYALLSNPAYGTLSGTATNLTYTPTNTSFTGTDTFNYIVYSGCGGDSAIGTVTVTIGDEYLYPVYQTLITGTNQTVAIILSAADNSDACIADTNYYTYTIVSGSGPTHGTLTGTPPNLIYKPNTNYEGMDSFQFTVSDGVWASGYPATVTIDVTAGLILFHDCNPFSAAVKLAWMLDTNEQQMVQQDGLIISDFIVYRSAHSGGPYTAIATNKYTGDLSWMSYVDTNAVVGQTNYYVVTFQAADSPSGVIVESPRSNEIKASGQNLNPLIPADAIWQVVTNLSTPTNVVSLQAPFSSEYPNQYPGLYPLPHTLWPLRTTWTNHITMFIPTNSVPLAQVTYSIAIDNQYWLYVNGAYVGTADNNDGNAAWSAFQPFPTNTLHYGTNNIVVGIQDWGVINYFSMIVFTNTCGW